MIIETSTHTQTSEIGAEPDRELRLQILKDIASKAGFKIESGLAAGTLDKPIKTKVAELHLRCPGAIELVEVMERENGFGRYARVYFPVAQPEAEPAYVPMVMVGGVSTIQKLAERENLRWHLYNGELDIRYAHSDLLLTEDDYRGIPELVDVMSSTHEPMAVAHRRATFVWSSLRYVELEERRPSIVKIYRNAIKPQSGEFFAHVLNWSETEPLIVESAIGSIAGVCVTNSSWYRSNHTDYQFEDVG